MFPTLPDIINYLFHTHLVFPIQTLGFFMAMAFIFSYQVFKSEFKRKENGGVICPFTEIVITGSSATGLELFINALLGLIFGFKILGAALNYHSFLNDPKLFIFSGKGSAICGILCALGFGYWAWYDRQKALMPTPVLIEKVVHPYELMPTIVFSAGFWGFIGAKLFDSAEHWGDLRYNPIGTLFSVNGFTYYGGLVFGALSYLYIGKKRGMKLAVLADIGSPGMMLAYGIGRIGCQLSGDGDWGIINNKAKPHFISWIPDWAWSYRYPHNELNAGMPMNGCAGNFCNQLTHGVYPTPFYEAALCILLFIFMWAIRNHLHKAGLMFYIYLIMNGTERFLIELIRVNIKYRFLGFYFSQAEWICVLIVIGGFAGIISIIYKQVLTVKRLHCL